LKIIRLSLHEEVAKRIRDRIYQRHLKPGDRIDEMALAAEFGISRTPLREALKVLQSEGLVTLTPRKGCVVAELSGKDLDDIYDLLTLLESRSAGEAATRASSEDIHKLQRLSERCEVAADKGDLAGYRAANAALHDALLVIGGNRWQHSIVVDLKNVLNLTQHVTLNLPGRMERSLQDHRELMDAISKRDGELARATMLAHVRGQRDVLRELERRSAARTDGAQAVQGG
jgi:DNA-binding GntR family transcriptional regulator